MMTQSQLKNLPLLTKVETLCSKEVPVSDQDFVELIRRKVMTAKQTEVVTPFTKEEISKVDDLLMA